MTTKKKESTERGVLANFWADLSGKQQLTAEGVGLATVLALGFWLGRPGDGAPAFAYAVYAPAFDGRDRVAVLDE